MRKLVAPKAAAKGRAPIQKKSAPALSPAKQLDAISKAMAGSSFRQAAEVLSKIRAVPTNLVQVDHALRVQGWPLERIAGIHGPAGDGKTMLVLLIVLSFLQRGHFVLYNDAEFTTAIDWVAKLMGPWADSPYFRATRTAVYEDAVDETREFFELVARLRAEKKVPEETASLVVVDSLRKLTPRGMFAKIAKGDGGVDGSDGRSGQIRAKFNSAWCDELPPLMARTGGSIIFVLREMEDSSASAMDKQYGNDWKVQGGKSMQFEPSILARVTRGAWVQRGQAESAEVLGERHKVAIRKSKVAGKDGKVSYAYFHSSNGRFMPPGHDRARDVLDLALKFGICEMSGSWVDWGANRLGNGVHAAVENLTKRPEWLRDLEAKVRAVFEEKPPAEYDEETGEVLE